MSHHCVILLQACFGSAIIASMSSTLRDVATLAQVSVSTASRALNRHPAITPETVSRVRRAADQLGYCSRQSHRRLDPTRSLARTNIGLLCLGMDRSLVELPVVASAISGAETTLSGAGATVHLTQVPDLASPPTTLLRKRLDGVILAGAMQGTLITDTRSELLQWLRTLPTVWLLGRPIGCWGDAVGSDDHATGGKAAEYLFERGHRRMAFVNPKSDHLLFMCREDSFVATARRLGAEVETYSDSAPHRWQLPLHAPESVETVQGLVDDLIAAVPRPTAIFAAADSVGTLIYRALAVRGLRAGADISVISANNDAALIQSLYPQLTTFDIHAHQLGRLAVRHLAMRITASDAFPETDLTIKPTLVEGGSVAPITVPSKH